MKFVGTILRVLAAVLAIAVLAAFFCPFVEVANVSSNAVMNGLECAIGTDLTDTFGVSTYKGAWVLASLVLTTVTAAFMVVSLFAKKKGWDVMAVITGLLNTILFIVFICNQPSAYVDVRPISGAELTYQWGMIVAVAAGIATWIMCIVAILVKDAVICKETGELTIPKKVVKFLREYKSELKKVVWPGPRSVVKNTLVVLGVCGVALLLIWLIDLGLGELFDLCFKTN